MLYRKLAEGEAIKKGDFTIYEVESLVGNKVDFLDTVVRPVPEPRSVEELTREELNPIAAVVFEKMDFSLNGHGEALLKRVATMFDELRSLPRETAKEKWIREYCIRVANADSYPPYDGDIRGALSDAWDAAIESIKGEENAEQNKT